jgi:replication factor A1
MTESSENLLDHILSKNPGMPREELLSLVERKKQESHGLLSDEGAVRLLAQQLAGLSGESINISDQRISSVQAGLSDATISGEILSASQLREFQRSDGSVGKLVRIKLKDGSGQITCVLWDSTAEIVEKEQLGNGSKLRLSHGYTRLGLAGEVEFHLGSRSHLEILSRTSITGPVAPSSAGFQESAPVSISPETVRVRIRKLQKSRGENGPTWALCENEEGLTMAKFWDDNMETVLSMGEGSIITIKNPWITERNGMVYLNAGSRSSITKETLDDIKSPPPVTIASIKPGPKLYTTRGVVVERTDPREIETREGRRTRVSNIRVEDGTGKIRIALWDNHAQFVESLRMGDAIRLTGIKARESSNGELEASTMFLTQIEKS